MKKKIIILLLFMLGLTGPGFAQVTAIITVSPGTTVCDNQSVTFTVAITGCTSPYSIDWIRNGFVQNTCTNPCTTWVATLPSGTQQIWCSVHCSPMGDTSSNAIGMTVNPCSGIEELQNTSLTTVYPNPSTENLVIDFISEGNLNYTLAVFDQTGNRMKVSYEMKSSSVQLSAKQFPQGLYYYKLVDEKGKNHVLGKFVITR